MAKTLNRHSMVRLGATTLNAAPNAAPSNSTVGRERRGRVSQLAWCGEGCFDSRRRVNSTVRPLIVVLSTYWELPMKVFTVQHVHEFDDGHEDLKFIGVYSTRPKAEDAVNRLKSQEGFRDLPEGFEVDEYELDEDHWTEGYITVK